MISARDLKLSNNFFEAIIFTAYDDSGQLPR